MPGFLNNINVVGVSPIITKIAKGTFPPPCEYRIVGVWRNKPYWFSDAIYPNAPFFIMSITAPFSMKDKLFVSIREAVWKDIERAFGILQAKWNILTRQSRFMSIDTMGCTIILHNKEMSVVEGEEFGMDYLVYNNDNAGEISVGGGVLSIVVWACSSTRDVTSCSYEGVSCGAFRCARVHGGRGKAQRY